MGVFAVGVLGLLVLPQGPAYPDFDVFRGVREISRNEAGVCYLSPLSEDAATESFRKSVNGNPDWTETSIDYSSSNGKGGLEMHEAFVNDEWFVEFGKNPASGKGTITVKRLPFKWLRWVYRKLVHGF